MKKVNKRMKRVVSLVVLVCMIFSLTACGKKDGPAGGGAKDDKVLKVAIICPLTGESAKAGKETQDAAAMALEDFGSKVGEYTIEPVYVDVTTDPEKGALALEQAIIKDGVEAALFGWNSSVVMSLIDVVNKYKIPYYFDHAASAGTIDEKYLSDPAKYSYFIAKGAAKPELLAANSYINVVNEAIKAGTFNPANKNIAIYGDDTDWGRSIGGAIRDSFSAQGWNVVYEDFFTMGTTDFYAILSKMKTTEPSIIAGTISSPASAAAFLKQKQELEMNNALVICDALSENADYYQLTGESVNYVLDNRPIYASEKGVAFDKKFKEKFGYGSSAYNAGQVWDYMHFFAKCCEGTIEKYGALNSENLHKYAQEVLLVGGITYTDGIVVDEYKFTKESAPGPVVGEGQYSFPVLQFMGPKFEAIWPSTMATTEFKVGK